MTRGARQAVLTGGCQCGAVRYALYARPWNIHLCHCRMCQKAVGGPFAALAPVSLEDFAWTRGEPAHFASSTLAIRHFCAACGTPLSYRPLGAERIAVTIGSLDRPAETPPERHDGVEGRLAWTVGLDDLPGIRTGEEDPPDFYADLVNYQHPDQDMPPDWRPRG